MAAKPKLPEQRQSDFIRITMTEAEGREIREAADAAGMAYAAFVRNAALTQAANVRRLAINVRQLTLPSAPPAPRIAKRRGRPPKATTTPVEQAQLAPTDAGGRTTTG